jgi:hypothetical protein
MGQIFLACAYDIENKKCCLFDADKFHANCYSYSGAVFSMHYLLRQAPYRIMWGGDEVIEYISEINDEEYLLGLSTFLNSDNFNLDSEELKETDYSKIDFIDKNSKLWDHIDLEDEAIDYFDWERNKSVKYSGYLVNHTKKSAIDLKDFFKKSTALRQYTKFVIDAVPFLTETGGGIEMAILNGITTESTENLSGTWCSDLLQIVDTLPDGYELINCCISPIGERAIYCFTKYGVNYDGLLLKDTQGNLFTGCKLSVFTNERGPTYYIKPSIEKKGLVLTVIEAKTKKAATRNVYL